MLKSVIASILAVSMGGNASAAASLETGAEIRAALDRYDMQAARKAFNALVESRLPASEPHQPDPLLDRLLVDELAAGGEISQAGQILERIVKTQPDEKNGHYRLLLGVYDEETGAFDDAARQYQTLAQDTKLAPEDRAAALLGQARVQMTVNPGAALTALQAIDLATLPSNDTWEFDLLSARAAAMAGPSAADQVEPAFQRAWAEAPKASLIDAAPARVASDRAMAAARAGDRTALVNLLAVDRFDRSANSGQPAVAADLPLCGADGITPTDTVIIEVSHLPALGRPKVGLVWASRPEIARPFLFAAARSGRLSVTDGQAASFALHCRTYPSSSYATRNELQSDLAGWMSSLGAYPLGQTNDDSDATVSIAGMLAQRQAQYGKTSVMLLPILFKIMQSTMPQIGFDSSAGKRADELATRVGAILDANRAPANLALLWKLSAIGISVAAQNISASDAQAEGQALLLKAAADPAVSLDMVYGLAIASADFPNAPSSFKAAILKSALDLLTRRAPAGDQRTAALALRLHSLDLSIGDDVGAATVIKPLGLSPDLCILSNPATNFISANITSDDYPGDLVLTTMWGYVDTEFDLDETGAARGGRIIMSDPPYVFDKITKEKLLTIRYDPARFADRPTRCRAQEQAIRWQMPY